MKERVTGMKLFVGLMVLFGVWCYCKYRTDWTFDNRMPRDGYETDHSAINRDLASGKSRTDVIIKANKGGYDVPKK